MRLDFQKLLSVLDSTKVNTKKLQCKKNYLFFALFLFRSDFVLRLMAFFSNNLQQCALFCNVSTLHRLTTELFLRKGANCVAHGIEEDKTTDDFVY